MPPRAEINFVNIGYVFLDRDGVLNRKPPEGQYVTRWEQFELLPGVEDALARLNQSRRKVIVVTNQRGVARGLYSLADVERMHERLQARLAARDARLDAIYICPHEEGQCNCRKPLTGMFEQAFRDFPAANAANSVIVGDSLRDIQAGRAVGMRTVLVDDPADSSDELNQARNLADVSAVSLSEFVERLLAPKI